MNWKSLILPAFAVCALVFAACSSKPEPELSAAAPEPSSEAASAPAPTTPDPLGPLALAQQLLASGKYDEAAARLFEVRASGKELNQNEAADFRTALEDAYSQAVEAAAKGEERGRVTLQMIKAASAR